MNILKAGNSLNFLKMIYAFFNDKFIYAPVYKSVQEQKTYLASFPHPADEYDYSYFKYLCLCFSRDSILKELILNAISASALPFLFTYLRLKGFFLDCVLDNFKRNDLIICKNSKRLDNFDILPNELTGMYSQKIDYRLDYNKLFLGREAKKIFYSAVKKHPFSFHYLLVLLVRLSQHCFLLSKYKPRCITTYACEREFADPLLTKLSDYYGVHYVGHMHGDYWYQIAIAFMHYSAYWVWDVYYREMLSSMWCRCDMPIYRPKKHCLKLNDRSVMSDYEYFATYYLTCDDKESIKQVRLVIGLLKGFGKKILVRPHPRFSDMNMIREIFDKEDIEDPKVVTMEKSLDRCWFVISTVSTVMITAYYSGKKVIIDDVTDPQLYAQAVDSDYIAVKYANLRLSELIEQLSET